MSRWTFIEFVCFRKKERETHMIGVLTLFDIVQ